MNTIRALQLFHLCEVSPLWRSLETRSCISLNVALMSIAKCGVICEVFVLANSVTVFLNIIRHPDRKRLPPCYLRTPADCLRKWVRGQCHGVVQDFQVLHPLHRRLSPFTGLTAQFEVCYFSVVEIAISSVDAYHMSEDQEYFARSFAVAEHSTTNALRLRFSSRWVDLQNPMSTFSRTQVSPFMRTSSCTSSALYKCVSGYLLNAERSLFSAEPTVHSISLL